jgi:glycosyltransferase involved in cell wall biosynthesis
MVSIVVPALNEAARIEACLRRLRSEFPDCELVVDGGSTDGTGDLAARYASTVRSAAGRATRMNAGAAVSSGDILWFIHADCQVPADALDLLRQALLDPGVVGGGLQLSFDQRSVGLDYLAASSNVRARRLGWIFSDQAMFVRREVFDSRWRGLGSLVSSGRSVG